MNNLIVDYFSFTVKNDSDVDLIGKALDLHRHLEWFCSEYASPLNKYIGGHLYTHGYFSFSGFRTYFGGKDTGHTMFVQISGEGCTLIDRYYSGGFRGFLHYLLTYCPNIKRIDLAADELGEDPDAEYNLLPDRLEFHKINGLASGSARKLRSVSAYSTLGKLLPGYTLYVGSRKADTFMRIYDKHAEQNVSTPGHWMRCELELHNNHALQAFIFLTSSENYQSELTRLYTTLSLGLIRFIDERKSNVSRSVTSDWWTSFLDGVTVGVRLSNHHEYKTLNTLMNWVDHSVLGAFTVVYETYGLPHLVKMMNDFVKAGRLSASHVRMIEEFDKEEERIYYEYYSSNSVVPSRTAPSKQFSQDIEVL